MPRRIRKQVTPVNPYSRGFWIGVESALAGEPFDYDKRIAYYEDGRHFVAEVRGRGDDPEQATAALKKRMRV